MGGGSANHRVQPSGRQSQSLLRRRRWVLKTVRFLRLRGKQKAKNGKGCQNAGAYFAKSKSWVIVAQAGRLRFQRVLNPKKLY